MKHIYGVYLTKKKFVVWIFIICYGIKVIDNFPTYSIFWRAVIKIQIRQTEAETHDHIHNGHMHYIVCSSFEYAEFLMQLVHAYTKAVLK